MPDMFLTHLLVVAAIASADSQSFDTAARAAALLEKEASLRWRTGTVDLPGGVARLDLPDGFRYLDPADSKTVLEDLWGNPDGEGTLGMVFGPGMAPRGDSSWGVVLTYEEDGHVDDKDAESIDYSKLLDDMRKRTEEGNAERNKQGFPPVHLVGWAERPTYARSARKLYWAKEIDFGSPRHTLNYNVRVLGRVGVLNLNAVSSMDMLGVVQSGMRRLLPAASFTPGNAYSDFDSGKDKMAKFGIAALVAGGAAVAAKAGLFKGLLALLIAAKKLIVVGVLALVAAVRAWFARRKAKEEARRFGQDLNEVRRPEAD
jgi:uncharacterized membrane-anchored protein